MPGSVRVLIIDDVGEMRELMKALVENLKGYEVTGAVGNTWEARLEIDRRRPDIVILDEILPGESSTDFLQEYLLKTEPPVSVVLVTGVENPEHPLPREVLGRLRKPTWKSLARDAIHWKKTLGQWLRKTS